MRYLLIWPVFTAYRRRARRSLRWRLAGYNMATLIAGLATALILVGLLAAVGASARDHAEQEPAEDARAVAEFLTQVGAVRASEPITPESLDAVAFLVNGTLPLYRYPRPDQFDVRPEQFLRGVSSIAVLAPELPPDGFERDQASQEVIRRAQAGEKGLRLDSRLRDFGGSKGVGAYPLIDPSGVQRGVVVVEKHQIQAPRGWAILRAEIRPVVTTVWVGSVVAAVPGLLVAALLAVAAARSVGGRVRDVSDAAEGLAAGNLDQRVPVRGEDEVASLARSFNLMAERLEGAMSSLSDERGRAVALLDANRQLVANVSHELRTPVALIRGQMEALDEDVPENPRVAMALRESGRLESLVTDLFELASADAGALRMQTELIDLAALVRESIGPLVELARREGQVSVSFGELPPVSAFGDADRLTRVLQNLVRNAIRHVPEGGLVRVGIEQTESSALVQVSDTGAGISPEDLPHVFERFYRGEASRNRETGGAGLGLAMAKELVEAMGGRIDVSSPPGEGAIFTISLPLSNP